MVVMGVYLMVMLGLGALGRARREEESLRDFYLAGSGFGFAVLFLTLFATQYSGNTLLGFAGRSYQQGLTYVVSVLFMIGVVGVYLLYAPRLFRLARHYRYLTPGDFIYHRFQHHGARILCVGLLCWGLANYILEQLVAMGHGMVAISGGRLGFMQGVILLAVVMIVYESLGGMRSVAWTDAVQGTLVLVGCAAILVALVSTDGGLSATAERVSASAPEKLAPPDQAGLRSWLSTFVLLAFGVSIYPHAIQRIFVARQATALRRSLAVMAFMPLITTLLAFLLGYVGLGLFPDLAGAESDKITIYVLSSLVAQSPIFYWLVVLVFAAVVAAIMSTADSALLSVGSMFTKDIYKAYLHKDADDAHLLKVGKIFATTLLAFLVLMAWVSLETESSLWFLIRLKLEFMAQLAPAIVLGVRWRRLQGGTVFAGMAAGTLLTLSIWVGVLFELWPNRSPWGINAGVWGLLLNVAICVIGTAWTNGWGAAAVSKPSGSQRQPAARN